MMDEAAAVREGARDLLSDIDPAGLRQKAVETVEESWLAPGVVTVVSARKTGVDDGGADLRRRAVGVQIIYAGLALTRRLVNGDSWATDEAESSNLGVLVADVLVARGGNLLAYTDASPRTVETIRRFGQRQTDGTPDGDRRLEADILVLGAHAGSTFGGPPPAPSVMEWAEELGESLGPGDLPETGTLVPAIETAGGGSVALAGEHRQSSDP